MVDGVTETVRTLAGRYQIGELLGRGGMAEVHAGTDARLGRRVAIKLLRPALANDPAFRTRFRQEAQAAARMAHPTIVRVYDAGEETITDANGHELQLPFIVMEHVQGRLLRDIIEDGPLDPAEAIRIIAGVLTALEYSHRAGVVHRDIKPGNIMVTPTGQVKVMDFGIARAISDSSANVAQTSAILGTAQYFSPEQARGEPVDARTDLYSAGVVLFEMLTGRPPFQADSPVAVAYQHVSEAPVPPSRFNPKVSPAIDAVVLRALSKDRFERYQNASEFRADAESAAEGKVPQRPEPTDTDFQSTLFGVNPNRVSGAEATVRQLTIDEDDRIVRTQTRPPAVWIWAGVLTMAMVVVAVIFWVFNLSGPQLEPSASIVVPDVTGQTWEEGSEALINAELEPKQFAEASGDVPAGQIIRTDPPSDESVRVTPGQLVKVWVSTGPQQEPVPAIAGLPADQASQALLDAGFKVGETRTIDSPDVPEGALIRTEPEGATAPTGQEFILFVSSGTVEVPNVVNQPSDVASAALSQLQLVVEVEVDTGCSGGSVSTQSLPPGKHPQKSPITITVCSAD